MREDLACNECIFSPSQISSYAVQRSFGTSAPLDIIGLKLDAEYEVGMCRDSYFYTHIA
jgi:hypothetical protein